MFKKRLFFYASLLIIVICKIVYILHINSFGWDGSYYFNIAQNIQNGLGFVTNLSLYHQGFSELPHPSSVYAIWPRLLGYLGQFISIDFLAIFLPSVFYIGTLLFLYKLGNTIQRKPLFTSSYFEVYISDILVYFFILHTDFFKATSKPYTEALTYFIFVILIYRLYLQSTKKSNIIYIIIETAFFSAILMQIRSQMVIVVISFIFLYLFWLIFHKKIQYKISIFIYIIVFTLVYLPQILFLKKYFGDVNLALLLFFDQVQTSQAISKLDVMVKKSNVFFYILDRLSGFLVAFKPWGKYSYIHCFHGIQYILFFIPLHFFTSKDFFKTNYLKFKMILLHTKQFPFYLFIIIFALLAFMSLHIIHKNIWATWNFATRHSFIITPIFILSFIYLYKYNSRKINIILNIVLMAYIIIGLGRIITEVYYTQKHYYPYEKKLSQLINFINSHEKLSIAMENPQEISRFTTQANYHWIYEKTNKNDFQYLFRDLNTKFLILHPSKKNWYTHILPLFKKIHSINGYDVYHFK